MDKKMHTVDITVFCIAQTRLNPHETREWLNHLGAKNYAVPFTGGQRDLAVAAGEETNKQVEVTDAGAVCGLCAKRCYLSFEPGLNPNVSKVRKNWYDYLTNILKHGHGSVTEHATWTFAIEGISRVLTGELNRHRAGAAISEGSMRYIRFDDIGFWMPKSLEKDNTLLMPTKRCKMCKGTGKLPDTVLPDIVSVLCSSCSGEGLLPLLPNDEFERLKAETREIFKTAFLKQEDTYKNLCNIWGIETMKSFDTKKKLTSLFRRLIGMGVATGGTWTWNTRALRHIVAMRTTPHAEEEIALVAGMVGKYMFDNEPALFGDFKKDDNTGAWVPAYAKI